MVTAEVDIKADGSLVVTPNPVPVPDGETLMFHVNDNLSDLPRLTVTFKGGPNSPFGERDRGGDLAATPCTGIATPVHWKEGHNRATVTLAPHGSPVARTMDIEIVRDLPMIAQSTKGPSQFIFHGILVKREAEITTVRLYPGLDLDLQTKDIEEIEEATDDVTQRTYVRVKLSGNAEIISNFKPRLARLASAAEGVPFAFGGAAPGVEHAMPSGGVGAIVPPFDPRGVAAFQGDPAEELGAETPTGLPSGAVFAGRYRPHVWATTSEQKIYAQTWHIVLKGKERSSYYTLDETGGFWWVADDESSYGH